VVIHTANLVYGDLHLKTDAAYIQDFPRKTPETSQCSAFERDLCLYLKSYGYEAHRHYWADDSEDSFSCSKATALTMTQLMGEFDFSTARAVLVPSVPGYHQGTEIHRYGHMKLRQAVRQMSITKTSSNTSKHAVAAVICQFSSMGSLNETWLRTEFGASATGTINNNLKSPIHLVFPTVEEVRCSVEGYTGGSSLPSNAKNIDKSFLKKLYHRWSSSSLSADRDNPFPLGRNLPHIKTYFRYDETGTGMQWFVLTSHNISSAAWGQLQKKGQQFFIRHWELGVFLSPETLVTRRLLPLRLKDDSFSANDAVVVPLPYKFHPEPYQDSDRPWAWDKVFAKADHFGRYGL
jgi:tyrosyl-DNA phosphodiesterase 1